MKAVQHARRLIVLLCLAAVLLALLASAANGLPFAILAPLWFFVAAIVGVPLRSVSEHCDVRQFSSLPVFAARPPPLQ